jgi:predicted ester cyclase
VTPEDGLRRLIHRLFEAADRADLETIDALLSIDFIDHHANAARSRGDSPKQAALDAFRIFLSGFPDTRHTLHDVIVEGDRVAVRVSAEGTHTGECFGRAPTGRRVRTDSIVIYRVENGQIAERWCRERAGVLDLLDAASAEPGPPPPPGYAKTRDGDSI